MHCFINICIVFTNSRSGLQRSGLLIFILAFASVIYVRKLIKNNANEDQNDDSDEQVASLYQKADAKALKIINNISFWCGMILMIYASNQQKEDPQFSYILFAIAGTLIFIWLFSSAIEIFYIIKYGKQ